MDVARFEEMKLLKTMVTLGLLEAVIPFTNQKAPLKCFAFKGTLIMYRH